MGSEPLHAGDPAAGPGDQPGDRAPAADAEGIVDAGTEPASPPETLVEEAQEALEAARRRLVELPAHVVVVNHVMGLYELAAIHLSEPDPDLGSAALAIDSVACLVEGLGERLGDDITTLRDALANIRLAFVQIKSSAGATP